MYKVVVGLKTFGVFDNEKDAVFALLKEIKRIMNSGEPILLQWLNTTCWIETKRFFWKNFYDSRDYAYENSWMKDGEFVDD